MQVYNPDFAALLRQGRRELALFRDVPFALAGSAYNRSEMVALGYRRVEVLPYFVLFDELLAAAASPAAQAIVRRFDAGKVNLLFVGRIVPNKRQADLLKAFHYYQALVNPQSRLLLVGSPANAPGYQLEIEIMADVLGLNDVHLAGSVSLQELGGFYRASTVFLSMSEHEGFGVPLLEAMAFDVPVLAYKCTAVPEAMGNAGVMFTAKRYDVVGEALNALVHDQTLRAQVIAGQRRRLMQLMPEEIAGQLRQIIDIAAT